MSSEPLKAAFIDRDGTLIEEVNFLSRLEDLSIFPYTAEALTMLRTNGFSVYVVTNQSGIARGHYDEAAMHAIHDEMARALAGLIDGFRFCPHMPDAGCECRKPNTGMIRSAVNGRELDAASSWMIGDKRLDIETGKNAGMRSALVKTGYGLETAEQVQGVADVIGDDLLDAVKQIIAADLRAAG